MADIDGAIALAILYINQSYEVKNTARRQDRKAKDQARRVDTWNELEVG